MNATIESLQQQEQRLEKALSNSDLSVSAKRKLEKELESIQKRYVALSAYQTLQPGQYVFKARTPSGSAGTLGKISEKREGTVFVVWGNSTIPIPEEPHLLRVDEFANQGLIKVGDLVRYVSESGDIDLGRVMELAPNGHLWIEDGVEINIYPQPKWHAIDDEGFSAADFRWLTMPIWQDINTQGTLNRASHTTLTLTLQWLKSKQPKWENHIQGIETKLSPRRLPIKSTQGAIAFNPVSTQEVLDLLTPITRTEDAEEIDRLLAVAAEHAIDKGLKLQYEDVILYSHIKEGELVESDGELSLYPALGNPERAIALCPPVKAIVLQRVNGELSQHGMIQGYTTIEDAEGVVIPLAEVLWEDGFTTQENGYCLEIRVKATERLPLGFQSVPISRLSPHPINSEIYGEIEDDSALEEMIQSSGWIKPLLVTPDGGVVGGMRRLRVANKLGIEEISVEVREFASNDSILESLLLDNAGRQKTNLQRVQEALFWLPIEKAKRRNSSEKNEYAREIVAKRVGIGSGKTLDKAIKVVTLAKSIRQSQPDVADTLIDLLNNKSIHAAFVIACNAENTPKKWQPRAGESVIVSLRSPTHAGEQGKVLSVDQTVATVQIGDDKEVMHIAQIHPQAREQREEKGRGAGRRGQQDEEQILGKEPEESSGVGRKENVIPFERERVIATSDDVFLDAVKALRGTTAEQIANAISWVAEENSMTDEKLKAIASAANNALMQRLQASAAALG